MPKYQIALLLMKKWWIPEELFNTREEVKQYLSDNKELYEDSQLLVIPNY